MLLEPLAAAADRVSNSLNTMGQRAGVLDELGTRFKGFMSGLGAGDGSVGSIYDELDRIFFGDIATIEADSDRLGKAFLTFKTAGENIRSAMGAFSSADSIGGKLTALGSGIKALTDSLSAGSALGLTLGALALGRLGGGLARLAFGGGAKLAVMAIGLTALPSSGDEMSAVDWASAAAGVAMLAGPVSRLAGSLLRLARGKAGLAVIAETAAAGAGAAAAGSAVPSIAAAGAGASLSARLAAAVPPVAIAAGAGWALYNGPQRQPESEKAGYVSKGRAMQPAEVAAQLNSLLPIVQGLAATAKALSTANPSSPLAQRRSADLATRVAAVDEQVARLQASGHAQGGGKATLDAIVAMRADIARLVPTTAPHAPATVRSSLPSPSVATGPKIPMSPAVSTPRPDILGPVAEEGERARLKAVEVGGQIQSAISVSGRLSIDSSPLDAANRKAAELEDRLARIPGLAAAASSAAAEASRSAARASNADGLYADIER